MKTFFLFLLTLLVISCAEISDYFTAEYPSFSSNILSEVEEITKAIDRNEEKVLKIKRILEIREDL